MRDAEEVAREALGCTEVHPDCPAWLHPTGFHTPPMPCTRCDALHAVDVIRARDAEVRAATLAEFTEYFAAAFTSSDGRVATMGHHVPDREYAMKEAVEMSSPEDATPSFVARRLVGPWEPEP